MMRRFSMRALSISTSSSSTRSRSSIALGPDGAHQVSPGYQCHDGRNTEYRSYASGKAQSEDLNFRLTIVEQPQQNCAYAGD
ncbi:hypothetical protein G6F31_021651 [Rhizopus arrhizus]|nr:hypothetical protein G6F31_021651 [Rhizopus arrhizus]